MTKILTITHRATHCDALRRAAIGCNWIHQKMHLLLTSALRKQFRWISFIKQFLWIKNIHTVAVSRNQSQVCSFCTMHCNCDATLFDMFIPVAVSRRPSPTVAARGKGVKHQAILCNWPVADNHVASRRLVWARLWVHGAYKVYYDGFFRPEISLQLKI